MPSLYNPFRPRQPIFDEGFAGREQQLDRIGQVLTETASGNPTYLLLVGERGIGKTSLLLSARQLADQHPDYEFLTAKVSISEDSTFADFCHRVSEAIESALSSSDKALEYLKKAWAFLQRVEVAGTKLNAASQGAHLRNQLVRSIVDTVRAVTNPSPATLGLRTKKDGLVIFIDEADKAAPALHLGSLIKELNERLVDEGLNKVLLVVAGLPPVKEVLGQSHPSVLRLFEVIPLKPLSTVESEEVITYGIASANVRYKSQRVRITREAVDYIVSIAGGHPYFLQQFGYNVYAADTDDHIDTGDVTKGVREATTELGEFYADMYDRVRHVALCPELLNFLATVSDEWISYDALARRFDDSVSELDNALAVLLEERLLVRNTKADKDYRLQWAGLAIWLRLAPALGKLP